jgi:importin-7
MQTFSNIAVASKSSRFVTYSQKTLSTFIALAFPFITRTNVDEEPIITKPLQLRCLGILVNTLYYNPILAISIMDQNNLTSTFFQKWFSWFGDLKRVHDKKLSIMAICAVLQSLPQAPPVLSQAAGQLLAGALTLFKELPNAIKSQFGSSHALFPF